MNWYTCNHAMFSQLERLAIIPEAFCALILCIFENMHVTVVYVYV